MTGGVGEHTISDVVARPAVTLSAAILGGVRLRVGALEVPLRGIQRRLIVGLLLAEAGRPVPAARLADRIRAGSTSGARDPVNAVHAHVARLRRLLDSTSGGLGSRWLASSADGYVLRPDAYDVWDYDELVRGCITSGRVASSQALTSAARALDLWSRPWGDLSDAQALADECRALELRHRSLEETWAALVVQLKVGGDHCDRLVELARAEPTRERRWALAMRALVQAGRQAEALGLYREARGVLADELGIEPGADLAATHQAVLHQDSSLLPPTEETGPDNVPVASADFVGRESDLDVLDRLVSRSRIVTVSGMGGLGKSRLVGEWVRRSGRHSMTTWVDLRGVSPDGVLARIAGELGLSPQHHSAPHLLTLIEAAVGRSPTVMVLDDADSLDGSLADVAIQLTALLGELTILVTARHPLGLTSEEVLALRPLPLPAPGRSLQGSAVNLAQVLLGSAAGEAQARHVAELGGGIPAALELIASRRRHADDRSVVVTTGSGAGVMAEAVMDAVEQLSPHAHELLERSIHLPGGMSSALAGALAVDPGRTRSEPATGTHRARVLRELVSASLLVTETSAHGVRYRVLQPVADVLGDASGKDRAACLLAVAAWARATTRDSYFETPDRGGLSVIAAEHVNLDAALQHLHSSDPAAMLDLAVALAEVWAHSGRVAEGHRWIEAALAAAADAGTVPGPARARALIALANSRGLAHIAEHGHAVAESVRLLAEAGMTHTDLWAAAQAQLAVVLGWRGDVAGMTSAKSAVRRAVAASGSEWFAGIVLELDGLSTLVSGVPLSGVDACLEAVAVFEALGDLDAAVVAAYFACVLARRGGMSSGPLAVLLRRSEEVAAGSGTTKSRALIAGESARFAMTHGSPGRADDLARALSLTERAGNLHHAALGRRDLGLLLLRAGRTDDAVYQLRAGARHLLRTDPASSSLAVAGLARLRGGGEQRSLAAAAWSLAAGSGGAPLNDDDRAMLLALAGPAPSPLPPHRVARQTIVDLLGFEADLPRAP
ncbi:BTAD domain-containing putative transcriptional regulator [Humibacillus xanthopallidus]|uniref:AfsR/SARP family transcriptional regulator n=1 Tax=Humibacillus xanthopallidus TaxID=412689 RepID=UPI00384F64AC